MRLFSVCSKAEQQMSREKYDFTARMKQLKLQSPRILHVPSLLHTDKDDNASPATSLIMLCDVRLLHTVNYGKAEILLSI